MGRSARFQDRHRRRSRSAHCGIPGQSGNPSGRPKVVITIRDLARKHGNTAINTLVAICKDKKQPSAARVAAANSLLDRGYGRAPQHIDDDHQDKSAVADPTAHRILEELRAEIAAGPEALLNGKSEKGNATT